MNQPLGFYKTFAGQLTAMTIVLALCFMGIVLFFYDTNKQILQNYDKVMNEELEKSLLNRVEMFVAIAHQAEKSFYAERDIPDADRTQTNLEQALILSRQLLVEAKRDQHLNEIRDWEWITQAILRYQTLFNQVLEAWKTKGLTRNSGLGMQLRTAAYHGLRDHVPLYDVQHLWVPFLRLKTASIAHTKPFLMAFKTAVYQSTLEKNLKNRLVNAIKGYESAQKSISIKEMVKSLSLLEEILYIHDIPEFALLSRTLLYYEMEYRELGRQTKHVVGVRRTLDTLRQHINESRIPASQKESLGESLDQYAQAFTLLLEQDKRIESLKKEINQVVEKVALTIHTNQKAIGREMVSIRQETLAFNHRNVLLNVLFTVIVAFVAIAAAVWMMRHMSIKVGLIRNALEEIARGNLKIRIHKDFSLAPRDELDRISTNVDAVASSLSGTMEKLYEKNRELEAVSGKLAKYLSPQVYDSIFTGRRDVIVQSQRKPLTVFFSDIVGFTQATESMEPEALSTTLNDYLNTMSNIALHYSGTIDKFIGDAILIFFGDPESKGVQEDALSCVQMALAMRSSMDELRQRWKSMGMTQPFRIRMGIASGYCTVGNFGSENRMDYTIIGGQVNLASRLESMAEPDQILISEETYAHVQDTIACQEKGRLQVKGISTPVQTYLVLDTKSKIVFKRDVLEESGEGYALVLNVQQVPEPKRQTLAALLEKMADRLKNT